MLTLRTVHGAGASSVYAGMSLRPLDCQGWNAHPVLYADLVHHLKPSVIVEVGVWKGLSPNHQRRGLVVVAVTHSLVQP